MRGIVVTRQCQGFAVALNIQIGAHGLQCNLIAGAEQFIVGDLPAVTQTAHFAGGCIAIKQHLAQLDGRGGPGVCAGGNGWS